MQQSKYFDLESGIPGGTVRVLPQYSRIKTIKAYFKKDQDKTHYFGTDRTSICNESLSKAEAFLYWDCALLRTAIYNVTLYMED